MKTYLTIVAVAFCLFLVSCTAETESIEPTQNFNAKQTVDQSAFLKDGDSAKINEEIIQLEGEPIKPPVRD